LTRGDETELNSREKVRAEAERSEGSQGRSGKRRESVNHAWSVVVKKFFLTPQGTGN